MYFKHIFKFTCLFVLIAFISVNAAAQTKTISGTVVDDSTKAPVAGVTIKVKNGPQTAVSDANGEFTLNIPTSGATLVYSHVAYGTGEVAVDAGPVTIVIQKTELKMDEVVVIGYG